MNKIRIFFGLCVLCAGAGCATVDVRTDWDKKIDFSRLKTYQWTSETQEITGEPALDHATLDEWIRKAVDAELARKGYLRRSEGLPDFKVKYHAGIEGKWDTTVIDPPYFSSPIVRPGGAVIFNDPGMLSGPRTFTTEYKEGSLIVDICDPQAKKLFYRGTMNAVLDRVRDRGEQEERIRAAVEKILKDFPPLSGGQ